MPAFEGLNQQKRSGDANAARRQSLSDQAPKVGILGTFFHKYVHLREAAGCKKSLTIVSQ